MGFGGSVRFVEENRVRHAKLVVKSESYGH